MEHVVFFPAHDGSPAFRRVATLDEAVRLVEHLRNVEGVSEVSCHALTEVPLAFRAWYRVEVPAAGDSAAAAVPEQAAEEPAVEVAPEVPTLEVVPPLEETPQVEPALASANGHSTDGAKSLGFFA